MANKTNKKELKYASFEELSKNTKFDFKNINFNSAQVCNSLLKMYDKGDLLNLSGNEEDAFLLLMKFFEAYTNLRKSKYYKENRDFVEKMIPNEMLVKTMDKLESLKDSLMLRYQLKAQIESEPVVLTQVKPLPSESIVSKTDSILNSKKFISPFDLTELISKTDLKYLIIDTRAKSEYDSSHMNLNILLNDPKTKSHCTFVNISNDFIEAVSWRIEDLLKKGADSETTYKIFASRQDYDYLILFDADSSQSSLISRGDSKLAILKKALYEYEQDKQLKNEPLFLDGGWSEWLRIYPGYSVSSHSNGLAKETTKTSSNSSNNSENALTSLKKTLDFDYPELVNFSKPTQPVAQILPNNNVSANNAPTAALIKSDSSETDLKSKTDSSSELNSEPVKNNSPPPPQRAPEAAKPQKPVVNRANKPVDLIVNDSKSDNNSSKKQAVFDLSSDEEEPVKDSTTTDNKKLSETKSVNVSSNQNITQIKFVPPVPPVPPQFTSDSSSSSSSSSGDKKSIQTKIFDSVYRPTIYRPIPTRDGTSKILDPDTGMFKIYTTSTQPAPKPNIVPAAKEMAKKSILKRTLSIPNISSNLEEEDEKEEAKETKEETKIETVPPKPAPVPTAAAAPKLKETNDLENETKSSKNSLKKQTAKPSINRDTKPMADKTNSTRSRVQELQPIYAAVSPGLTGIRNLGNTCFMNSIIQCLNSTQPLVDYFQAEQYMKDLNRTNNLGFRGEIAEEFSVIVSASWSGHCKTIAPRKFKNVLGQFNSQFVSNEQQDAQELLLFLLDGLHEDLNRIRRRPKLGDKEDENENLSDEEAASLAWRIHLSMNNSIIVDLFQGQFKSTVTCLSCQKKSVKFDAFMYLTLPILANKCTLYQCLEMFLKPESMTGESKWKCPQCKQYRDAVKKIDIWKLPPILIVHLKRFRYHGLWRDKITTMVDYPIENLNLDKYILNNSENKRLGVQNYKLYAMSNHSGTLDGGHYVAHCRHRELNKWFKYDDTEVKEVFDNSSLKSSTSYILFYSRI